MGPRWHLGNSWPSVLLAGMERLSNMKQLGQSVRGRVTSARSKNDGPGGFIE